MFSCNLPPALSQNDWDLLGALTHGWNGYWKIRKHRQLSLEGKFLLLLLLGPRSVTFWSWVWHSTIELSLLPKRLLIDTHLFGELNHWYKWNFTCHLGWNCSNNSERWKYSNNWEDIWQKLCLPMLVCVGGGVGGGGGACVCEHGNQNILQGKAQAHT